MEHGNWKKKISFLSHGKKILRNKFVTATTLPSKGVVDPLGQVFWAGHEEREGRWYEMRNICQINIGVNVIWIFFFLLFLLVLIFVWQVAGIYFSELFTFSFGKGEPRFLEDLGDDGFLKPYTLRFKIEKVIPYKKFVKLFVYSCARLLVVGKKVISVMNLDKNIEMSILRCPKILSCF